MAGGFVFVVGPSGAGKDTLIRLARAELCNDPRFSFPRRLVTREASTWEDNDTIDDESFARSHAAGAFTLSWRAHGLGYALPGSCRDAAEAGQVVVCNLSRTLIGEARKKLPNVSVVEVTASVAVLAARLALRGRSEDGNIGARIARSREVGAVAADLTIVNEGAPETAGRKLTAFLRKCAELDVRNVDAAAS
ncbi:phosphonate metabolism protein/1,5-bisphosphokinase (PRPP-forming) PhnN [Microvirga massiliensis]|uniref:phosphonate metabolism protein/1,5-bisphosphokinase (PRPP-forming) PhnN n=1 Tax=Microvirga massiliensis TaxID=1033741 RepID=UPI00062B8FFE|nr:phosphonate metabolism protein/1,5-bisphosphokinase (PRPP-forming) PhnN [Microvirga massiliensis]